MNPVLQTALGSLAIAGPGGLTLVPSSTRQLTDALQILASQGASLNSQVQLSLAELTHVLKIEPKAGTVEVGGGMSIGMLDTALAGHQLTLGPLTPRARFLTLSQFLEGPDAGLRAIPGGRLEPICLAITAVLPDGRVYRSHPSPRSAAGPDLVALMLGGQRRLGVITEAVVRCFPFSSARKSQVLGFPSPEAFVAALMACLSDGVWFESVRVETRSARVVVEVNCVGTSASVERDVHSLGRRALEAGGLSTGKPSGGFSSDLAPDEREATWDAVGAALASGHPLELHRLSLASVVARGEISGMDLSRAGAWSATPAALAAALDPGGVLGGAP